MVGVVAEVDGLGVVVEVDELGAEAAAEVGE